MAQQTAVQCLIDELRSGKNLQLEMTKCGHIITEHDNVLNKILQMEKEQIVKAYVEGINLVPCDVNSTDELDAEKYYHKTFGNK